MSKKKKIKRFRCPYCMEMVERNMMGLHVEDEHMDILPKGISPSRMGFNIVNKKETAYCTQCKTKETKWNEEIKRYERFCSETCRVKAGKLAKKNLAAVGKADQMTDPEHQMKMLSGRSISGIYKYGKERTEMRYTGKLERSFLEYMDKVMNFPVEELVTDEIIIKYEYGNKERFYIPDFYIPMYNLIIEIKDGGQNKNTNPGMVDTKAKVVAKEKQIKKDRVYNYLRLTDKNYDQLIMCMNQLKNDIPDMKDDKLVIINESVDSSIGDDLLKNHEMLKILFKAHELTTGGEWL